MFATFDVENLFSRVRATNNDDPAKTTVVLAAVAEFRKRVGGSTPTAR